MYNPACISLNPENTFNVISSKVINSIFSKNIIESIVVFEKRSSILRLR